MKIGELAERTGLNPSRIRFYESIGLLKMVERQANGYRRYPPEAVLVLNLITTAQKAGFSLDELRTLLPQDLSQWQHGTLLDTLQGKVRDIEALERQLGESKRHLLSLIAEIESKPDDIDCATNARRVLSGLHLGEQSMPALEGVTPPGRNRSGRQR
ncbi:DNA-binding transcriptional MerR regulator [Pseudomonas fluvialis]|uniref:DNA-binding transcriptional MerR regulator n=1 Tax=Pseudomonas fluvialis TaxID=1793966 RepID=A0A7X0BW91_9PSED|nr:MerR family transcriptional regulator [Pseudomonas fluvialis]MBB6343336.1 DNA-binding transcriptional MerR regulator [Pseudomonas fluvialis]